MADRNGATARSSWSTAGDGSPDASKTNRSLVVQQEKAESEDRITLKSLRAFADALDCDLVYAFVPRAASLQELVDARVRAAAKDNVLGMKKLTSHTASSTFSPCNVVIVN